MRITGQALQSQPSAVARALASANLEAAEKQRGQQTNRPNKIGDKLEHV